MPQPSKEEDIKKSMGTAYGKKKAKQIAEKKAAQSAKKAVTTAIQSKPPTQKSKKKVKKTTVDEARAASNSKKFVSVGGVKNKSKTSAPVKQVKTARHGMSEGKKYPSVAPVPGTGLPTGRPNYKKTTKIKIGPSKAPAEEIKKAKKTSPKGQVEKGANPLKDKPRSISAARKAGEKYFWDKKGTKKLAVTGEELKKKGMTVKEWANTFAKRKQTKQHAKSLEGFAKSKKRTGGILKMRGGGLATKGTSFSIY